MTPTARTSPSSRIRFPTDSNTAECRMSLPPCVALILLMLITPRLYQLAKTQDKGSQDVASFPRASIASWSHRPTDFHAAAKMLLLHQTGSVKVGEVVRYTLTYTPSADRILPAPTHLYVKIKNTSALPLRAAYLHGPYTLYAACYPATFDPNKKHSRSKEEGVPDFEPNLKAGGQWSAKLTVPEDIRVAAGGPRSRQSLDGDPRNVTWIIELASQVLFSTTAAVHFELLVGRDERSVDLGFHAGALSGQGMPGKLEDHQQGRSRNAAHAKGVFSKAIKLVVDDTESLWNTPPFPRWDDTTDNVPKQGPGNGGNAQVEGTDNQEEKKRQKIHLVILTHGLHSNLGADMLYLKESIDAAAKQAREDSRKRKDQLRNEQISRDAKRNRRLSNHRSISTPEVAVAPTENVLEDDDDEDEEQVIVRGFNGNAVRTERGIQYLGKRLAKFVLSITYPDQPYLPVKSSISQTIARSFTISKTSDGATSPAHKHSSIVKDDQHLNHSLAYQITSISFVGHSLGGVMQTYAIAYIQKHSPEFFDIIKPINFVALASPFLGLSNENPLYVKFALDFGLVGRTGQDLGLTWRAPTVVRSGWGAMIGGLTSDNQKSPREEDPAAKPLLRVLPTGPAHVALKKFRNRSVYSNVVNDGIVPLRTSCLLFLDWRGLGRVEKARRENGLVGTMVGWGWAEMMGQNASSPKRSKPWADFFGESDEENDGKAQKPSSTTADEVPQADAGAAFDDDVRADQDKPRVSREEQYQEETHHQKPQESSEQHPSSMWAGFMSFFKPQAVGKPPQSRKKQKIYYRGQITNATTESENQSQNQNLNGDHNSPGEPRSLVRGSSLYTNNSQNEDLEAPPKTTFFEAAGDLLSPPLPSKEFLINPESRPRTIFHDRIYHPEDIPPPPSRLRRSLTKRVLTSNDRSSTNQSEMSVKSNSANGSIDIGAMKIEEKIARAYHKDLSWRKVLVRLEPDAHNNIIVRRMFANAYGWPVVKHLCDTHFAYTAASKIPDDMETNVERAKAMDEPVDAVGEEVRGQTDIPDESVEQVEREPPRKSFSLPGTKKDTEGPKIVQFEKMDPQLLPPKRTDSELRESTDQVHDLVSPSTTTTGESSFASLTKISSRLSRRDSGQWSDRFFDGSEDESDETDYLPSPRKERTAQSSGKDHGHRKKHSLEPEIADSLTESPTQSSLNLAGMSKISDDDKKRKKRPPPMQIKPGDGLPDMSNLSLQGLGLNKSVEESMSVGGGDGTKQTPGVAEQIALARSKSLTEEDKNLGG